MAKRKQKIFLVRFVSPFKQGIRPTRVDVKASSKEIARRKFKRESIFGRKKITSVTEIK